MTNTPKQTGPVGLRKMACSLNPLSRADCSTLLSQGGTQVLAAVNGPLEPKMRNFDFEKLQLEVAFRPNAGLGDIQNRLLEKLIKGCFAKVLSASPYTRALVAIYIQEMTDKGGLMACTLNAICMALMNSGMDMLFLVAAVHSIITEDGTLILDPDEKQMTKSIVSFTFVFDSVEKKIVTTYATGKFSMDDFERAHNASRTAADEIFAFYKNATQNMFRMFRDT